MNHRIALTFLLGLTLAQAGLGQTNLIPNGDFETLKDDVPVGWLKANTANTLCVAEGTNHFLRLHATEPDKMINLYRIIPIPPGTEALALGYRVRYEAIKPGSSSWFDGRIMMKFMDADGKDLSNPPAPYWKGTRADWTNGSIRFSVPEKAKSLALMPALFKTASGTLDLDDLTLEPIDASVLTAQAEAKTAEARAKVKREAGANIIKNGDFETVKNGAPEGWFQKPSDNMTLEAEDGNHFVRMKITEPGKTVQLYKLFPLAAADRALELTFRVRYADIKAGKDAWNDGRIMMNFKDVGKKGVAGAPAPYFRGTSQGWRTVTNRFFVPATAAHLEFMPCLFMAKAGTIDYDDFRLVSLGDAEADAMAAAKAEADSKKAAKTALIDTDAALPPVTPAIKVAGNRLVTLDGKPVWLQGLSCDSMQWGPGEDILWAVRTALTDWRANVIRLAVKEEYWFGDGKGPAAYRETVDKAVKLCAGKGAWLVLDLHRFGAPMPAHAAFWKSAAERYKNNPAVLFELFNEPHGISWTVWRDGGNLKGEENKHQDVNPTENNETNAANVSIGMQALVDAVRSTGASNTVLAGGLDWSYDISGIVKGYALDDRGGNGIIYVSHIYPWKNKWQEKVLVTAEKHPVIITEVGCPRDYKDFPFIKSAEQFPLEGWSEDVIGLIQSNKLHWTAFSFHPRCGPMIISDWNFTPTPYWGVYVKEALAGKSFEMKKMR